VIQISREKRTHVLWHLIEYKCIRPTVNSACVWLVSLSAVKINNNTYSPVVGREMGKNSNPWWNTMNWIVEGCQGLRAIMNLQKELLTSRLKACQLINQSINQSSNKGEFGVAYTNIIICVCVTATNLRTLTTLVDRCFVSKFKNCAIILPRRAFHFH